jgi:hypothetical protein
VLHPFNEYLLILAEFGILGLGVATALVCFLIRAYRRSPGDEKLAALTSLLALSVFSFFSYPFKYPFTWLILLLCVAIICNSFRHITCDVSANKTLIIRAAVFLLSAGLTAYAVLQTYAEMTWKRIARRSLAGQTLKVLPEYDKLYPLLGRNGLFLYNHAAELHHAKEYERSIAVFERCTRRFNDMDVHADSRQLQRIGKIYRSRTAFENGSRHVPGKVHAAVRIGKTV